MWVQHSDSPPPRVLSCLRCAPRSAVELFEKKAAAPDTQTHRLIGSSSLQSVRRSAEGAPVPVSQVSRRGLCRRTAAAPSNCREGMFRVSMGGAPAKLMSSCGPPISSCLCPGLALAAFSRTLHDATTPITSGRDATQRNEPLLPWALDLHGRPVVVAPQYSVEPGRPTVTRPEPSHRRPVWMSPPRLNARKAPTRKRVCRAASGCLFFHRSTEQSVCTPYIRECS